MRPRRRPSAVPCAGPACVIVKHTNPCGAAERADPRSRRGTAALAGDPVSAFGGVVALTRPVDAAVAEALVSIFLEVVVAPAFDDAAALAILAGKPNLRLVVDPDLADDEPLPRTRSDRLDPLRRWGRPRERARHDGRRSDDLDGRHQPSPDRRGDPRPGPRLAPCPRRDLERDRAGQGPPADRDGVGPDLAGRRGSRGRRPGACLRRGGRDWRVLRAPPTRSTRSRTRSRSVWRRG